MTRERKLEQARQFERVAMLIDEALAAGSLVPDPEEPWGPYEEPIPYTVMREAERTGKGIPDAIGYFFRCTFCSMRFNLSCNFYHGGGGIWRVVGP